MTSWRLLIVAASALAALAVGLQAQANPQQPPDLDTLLAVVGAAGR